MKTLYKILLMLIVCFIFYLVDGGFTLFLFILLLYFEFINKPQLPEEDKLGEYK